jgi:hypothetical protein
MMWEWRKQNPGLKFVGRGSLYRRKGLGSWLWIRVAYVGRKLSLWSLALNQRQIDRVR